ncbi:phosphoglycerate kinase [Candidatus Bipolaricaulota bacterium]|nr:phosphoglycerate kinase [Candidatus Bipolaricaulota bacterium]
MKLRDLREAEVRGKKVLLRADFNVPLKDGVVAEDFRIRKTLPTINWLRENGASVAVISHLGRPKGKVVPALSLAPVARRLADLLGEPIAFITDCVGDGVRKAVERMEAGDVLLLENLRFHPGEEENDPGFAQELAAPFDLYVNDAFAVCHRAHASTVGLPGLLPAYAGFLLQEEIRVLSKVRDDPDRPFFLLIGGKKAKDKLGVLEDLLPKVDAVLVGGGAAFTFLKARGLEIGRSVFEEDLLPKVKGIAERAEGKLLLPVDVVVSRELSDSAETQVVPVERIPPDAMGLDIGPETVRLFSAKLREAATVVWAGPMGAFEYKPFAAGTEAIARALAEAPGFTVVGGGETGEAVIGLGLEDKFGHLSTGGGATLDFLRGRPMPALEPLMV